MQEAQPGETKRPRGRPPYRDEQETRRLIVDGAAGEFLTHGYAAANMDAVARRAGVSKKTIYRLFEAKADLLAAMMSGRFDQFLMSFDTQKLGRLGLQEGLEYILGRWSRLILSETSVALFRLVVAESTRFPELASTFYREGPARSIGSVANWLEAQRDRGLLEFDDVPTTASMLLSMITAEPLRRAALGLEPLPSDSEIDRRVEMCVRFFLNGCRTQPAGTSSDKAAASQ